MRSVKYGILFLLFGLTFSINAQQPFFRDHELPEELSHIPVKSIYQSDGYFLWLASENGLVLYDGHQYELLTRSDSLADNRVSSIFRDRDSILWIGYQDGGIFQYDVFNHLKAWQPEEGWPSAAITGFVNDRAGNLWLATYGEGLYYWNGKRLYNFGTDDGLAGADIYTLQADADGRVWAGTDDGISICWLDGNVKKVKHIDRSHGLPDEIVRVLEPVDEDKMWVGTYDRGFGLMSTDQDRIEFWMPEWDHGVISSLEVVSADELWIGTEKSGIWRYRLSDSLLSKITDARLNMSRISDLHRDAEGNMWILSNTNQLLSANLLFEFIQHGISNVQAMLMDDYNRLWVGTQQGLFLRDHLPSGADSFHLQLPVNCLSLYQDNYGNIWAGTFGEGLYIFKPDQEKYHLLTESNGLTNGSIFSIDGIRDRIWLATLGGVTEIAFRNDPVLSPPKLEFRNYSHEDGLGTNFIYKVFVDSKEQVWFATDGEGVSRLSSGRFEHLAGQDSLPVRSVYTITEDARGNIWFSSPKEGIFLYDGRQIQKFELSKGLRNNDIAGMATDRKGKLVLIHPDGIDLLDPAAGQLIYYDKEVGIGEIEPNLNAFCEDTEGNIWIGTQQGIIRYSSTLPVKQIQPQAQLRGISVDLQAIDFNKEHIFPHHRNNLIFDYSGLWYSDPESVRYRYKLEGFNPDWIISRDQRAVYSQLPPGDYTFCLSASDNDLFFPEPQIMYRFTITPPFWRTPWFAILITAIMLVGIYLIMRQREKRLEKQAMMRREKLVHQFELLKSQINPHFLFNNFNTLITLIEENPPAAVTYVERLSDFYRSILQYRQSPVIALEEELDLLRNYASILKERFADNLQIRICDRLQSGYIIPLTLQLLVENAIKHNTVSRNNPLTISISEAEEGYIVVQNNLQKKWRAEASTGFGLESISKRYAILTDKKVKMEKDNTRFTVSIPMLNMDASINGR
ncbi:MAG: two-component regulator propeller domain-containing protein [Saprospiraceae bacterium]|nr:histidine kinase [Lewinella sp.]